MGGSGNQNFVSIPFKRESVSKVLPRQEEEIPEEEGFNSLQTGKCIQRVDASASGLQHSVSIPFKRESVSKVGTFVPTISKEGFNSLQTGKCIQSV